MAKLTYDGIVNDMIKTNHYEENKWQNGNTAKQKFAFKRKSK